MPKDNLDLPPIAPEDSVATLITQLIEGLRFPASDEFNNSYLRIRAILRSHPLLKHHLPEFLVGSKTVADYRSLMMKRFSQTYEWDAFSGNELSQLYSRLSSGSSLDAYDIKGPLGWGGFGRVFLAQHRFVNRPFAIKVFQPAFHQGGGSALGRFFQEASMLYELDHPNIIRVREVGLIDERPFIVMDHFDGIDLNKAMRDNGAMPPDKALRMCEMIAEAVEHAHSRLIVHRDLKPSNIMLSRGQCRVIDFGLGVYVEQELFTRLTRSGESPAGGHFTARELCSDPRLIDPRSDIYSIGAIWYNAVTNEMPAGANLTDSLLRVATLPESHRSAILRCLSDVAHRYSTCTELLNDIRAASIQGGSA
jgi:serine/threonine protein kinase